MDTTPQLVPESPSDFAIPIDLYCLYCGYNLRGLSGDPRRCPECGRLNRIGDIAVPAREIKVQLTLMETAPASCVAAIVAAMTVSGFAILVWSSARGQFQQIKHIVLFAGVVDLLCAAAWFWCMTRFRKACLDSPQWQQVLFRYSALGVLACAAVGLPVVLAPFWNSGLLMLAAWGSVPVTIWATQRFVYVPLREQLDALQRTVAVEIARQRLRRGNYG